MRMMYFFVVLDLVVWVVAFIIMNVRQSYIDVFNNWKWNSLPNMTRKRMSPSAIMIDLSDGTKKLLRIGGHWYPNNESSCHLDAEIYDFKTNTC